MYMYLELSPNLEFHVTAKLKMTQYEKMGDQKEG